MAEDKNPFDTMNKLAKMIRSRRPTFLGGTGVKMMQYLMHEKLAGHPMRPGMANPDRLPEEERIHSSHPEAFKKCLSFLGVRSDNNRDGIPIGIDAARKIFFGENQLSEIEESEWRATMLNGDKSFDRKKMRQMINFDGSTTYEILNNDKSVMAKFTFGTFKDSKVFSEGGYDSYANELRNILNEGQKNTKAQMEFAELQMKMQSDSREKEKRFGGEETFYNPIHRIDTPQGF